MVEHTHWHTLALLGCFDRSRTDVWGFCCPGRDRDRGMEREGNRWIVSQHSAFVSAPWRQRLPFAATRPSPPTENPLKVGQSTLCWSVPAGPSHLIPCDARRGGGGGKRALTKKHKGGEKLGGGIADSTLRGWRKDIFLLKINVSCLSGALQQNGKKEKSLFSIIIQTCSTKTTNHIHKPLIGTVYLSENIIEPKNKKSCFIFKNVSW